MEERFDAYYSLRVECKYWLHPDRVDSVENFEYNCTPRMTRGASAHLEHFDNAGFGDLYSAGQPPRYPVWSETLFLKTGEYKS